MCGIVGYIGFKDALPILIDGLKRLEYRGYDSAGVAINTDGGLYVMKKKGRLSELEEALDFESLKGNMGIGHTRWATHGNPSDENSHPHTNMEGSIALVHNGIIENHGPLRRLLAEKGYQFLSQTDTEVLLHLIDSKRSEDISLYEAVQSALKEVRGTYALCVIDKDNPDEIIAARKDSPLVLGIGQGEYFIASDIPAIIKHTREVCILEDGEAAILTREGIKIFASDGMPVEKSVMHVAWDVESAEKGGYPHFMIKEIHEEPKAVAETLNSRLALDDIHIEGVDLASIMKDLRKVFVVACGTAYHAGLMAKYTWERVLRLQIEVEYASEFRYRSPIISKGDLVIIISQSGETLDTLSALRLAKSKGAKILAITNVVGSSISRESDYVMHTWAGPEIAVASTKAYSTQVLCLAMLMLKMANMKGFMVGEEYQRALDELRRLPAMVADMLGNEKRIEALAERHYKIRDAYFIGRSIDSTLAMEASLKLKEISYIHSEAFPAGELKHGPIALLEEGTVVIAFATQPELFEKTANSVIETRARGAYVIAIADERAQEIIAEADEAIKIPPVSPWLAPVLAVMPAQIFAYYCSVKLGYDVDKPRNLAKSVTVE
ncbi:MAG: glutamine--fructose-6-phosphate transaminase (isomerizing) [Christensenellales bacterium]|jgi:glucosamine--fructose-6-phosphate aminotransferase (isomerizing)